MHRSRSLGACALVARFYRSAASAPGLRERAAHVAERAVNELEQRFLNLDAPRGSNFRAVAFRHTQAMVDMTPMLSHLNVKNLYAERCERAHERLEHSAVRRQA